MTARLRVLPVWNGDRGQHYLVLDSVGDLPVRTEDVKRIRAAAGDATVLVFRFPVDLPDVDEETAAVNAAPAAEPDYGPTYAQLAEEAKAKAPAPEVCKATFCPTQGSLAACDGLTHDRGFHEGTAENGVPYRWRMPEEPKPDASVSGYTMVVDLGGSSTAVDIGREVRKYLRDYEAFTVRRG